MTLGSYLRHGWATTKNILVNAATLGRQLALEGRVEDGEYHNWLGEYRHRPRRFVEPSSEAEIVEVIKSGRGIRVMGAGHSFNAGVVEEETLVSLDRYAGVISKDLAKKQVTVRGGTRVRDLTRLLLAEGLAFEALPSHDAQSIAGVLSTDVHGTGRDWGFVSDSVVALTVIDGRGEVLRLTPTDELFKAAIGGIGAVGVITEVTVQAVARFNVEQKVELADADFVAANLDRLLAAHEHLSLYLFPFTRRCHINTWNRTDKASSFAGSLREFVSTSVDASLASWLGDALAHLGLLPRLATFSQTVKRGTNLVLESHEAFNRTIYHDHQELEFAVPYAGAWEACQGLIRRYEALYRERALPYALFEVRFTPDGHERTLVGPGRSRRSAWIDIIINNTDGYERFYDAVEDALPALDARPHLGKHCVRYNRAALERAHGDHLARFQALIKQHDPDGRFANAFTRRLFSEG